MNRDHPILRWLLMGSAVLAVVIYGAAYRFTILDTVIPAASTLAEPSASDLASLIALLEAHGACIIVTETTASSALASTVAAEREGCDEIQVLQLYTGAISPVASDAGSYIGLFRANVDAIVAALQQGIAAGQNAA